MPTMPHQERNPGIVDVASLAGVSRQTVSRVVNDHPNVNAGTRARVKEAIAQLNYRRNASARSLVTNRSGLLGIITTSSLLPGPIATLASIEDAARQRGYMSLTAAIKADGAEELHAAIDSCLTHSVEALIVIAQQDSHLHVASALTVPVPMFVIGSASKDMEGSRYPIAFEQSEGGRLAAAHLADLGHTDLLHVAGPLSWTGARQRMAGWQSELARRELDGSRILVGDWTAASGYAVGVQLLRGGRVPSGIFAANDHMALGLMGALHKEGVRIPEDVSLVGYDDIEGAAFFEPPLTTIRQNFLGIGGRVLDAVTAVLNGDSPELALPSPELVRRATSSALVPMPGAPQG